jgi:hypothetical protein
VGRYNSGNVSSETNLNNLTYPPRGARECKMPVKRLFQAVAAAFALCVALTYASSATAALPTAWAFSKRPTVTNLEIAPDGKHIAGIVSPDGRRSGASAS